MKWICAAAAAALLAGTIPAAAIDCPGEYVVAGFPDLLPSLGEEACPTSENVGKGARLIQQSFILHGVGIDDFLERYLRALAGKGWGAPETGQMGQTNSLNIRHPQGYHLQLVIHDLYFRETKAGAPGEPADDEPPVTRVKLTLHRSP